MKIGDRFVNRYSQEVRIEEINDTEVVILWIEEDCIDAFEKYEFAINFKKVLKNE